MAALLTRKKTVYAKAESVYATDPTIAAADAVQTKNLTITPLEGGVEPLDFDNPVLGTAQSIHIGMHVVVEFDVPFAGSGAAGTAPAYDALLEACGLAGTNVPATSETYAGDSTSTDSVALECNLDGTQHQVLGCRGTCGFNLSAGAVPFWHFRFLGLYSAPTAVADPTPDVTDYVTPVPVTSTNTAVVTIHAQAFEMASIQWDLNNEVVFDELAGAAGAEEIMITNRAPSAQVEVRSLAIGTFSAVAVAVANTEGAVSVVHGITAGNILTLAGAQVQILSPSYSDRNGVRNWSMGLQFNRTVTDNDFTIANT